MRPGSLKFGAALCGAALLFGIAPAVADPIAPVSLVPALDVYVDALVASGYRGYVDWEFCHPAMEGGKPAGIEYVHNQSRLAIEYMRALRAEALESVKAVTA